MDARYTHIRTCLHDAEDMEEAHPEEAEEEEEAGPAAGAVVLHEDKKYYPTAEEVYGPGVESLVSKLLSMYGVRPHSEGGEWAWCGVASEQALEYVLLTTRTRSTHCGESI
eukprot:scaffold60801_cov21-Tisochrysis_lutea.AAC.2